MRWASILSLALIAGCASPAPAAPTHTDEAWTSSVLVESYLGAAVSDPAGTTVLEGCDMFALDVPKGVRNATIVLVLLPPRESPSAGSLVLSATPEDGESYSADPVSSEGDRAEIALDAPAAGSWHVTVRPEHASVEQTFALEAHASGEGPRGSLTIKPNAVFC